MITLVTLVTKIHFLYLTSVQLRQVMPRPAGNDKSWVEINTHWTIRVSCILIVKTRIVLKCLTKSQDSL